MSGSNNDFNSDLEAILAEFASYSSNISGTPDAPQEGAKNAPKADAPTAARTRLRRPVRP